MRERGGRWFAHWCVNVLFTWTGWGPKNETFTFSWEIPQHSLTCRHAWAHLLMHTQTQAEAHAYILIHAQTLEKTKKQTQSRLEKTWKRGTSNVRTSTSHVMFVNTFYCFVWWTEIMNQNILVIGDVSLYLTSVNRCFRAEVSLPKAQGYFTVTVFTEKCTF